MAKKEDKKKKINSGDEEADSVKPAAEPVELDEGGIDAVERPVELPDDEVLDDDEEADGLPKGKYGIDRNDEPTDYFEEDIDDEESD
ncbi:MAG: hypothetical protein HZA95_03600 [Candidatus Vogelbacteria bacterium]|nr:hypothetical protein [Candidatus Vogelbacteria bacterium]